MSQTLLPPERARSEPGGEIKSSDSALQETPPDRELASRRYLIVKEWCVVSFYSHWVSERTPLREVLARSRSRW